MTKGNNIWPYQRTSARETMNYHWTETSWKTEQFKKDNWIIVNLKVCWKDKRNGRSLLIVGKKYLQLICWNFKIEKGNLNLRWVTHLPNEAQSYSNIQKCQNNFSYRRTRCSRWIALQSAKDTCQQVGNSLYWLENSFLKKRSKFKLPPCLQI